MARSFQCFGWLFGPGSFEVGLALQAQQVLNLSTREIGFAFARCRLVMILVQAFLLSPLRNRTGGERVLAPALPAMTAGVELIPFSLEYSLRLAARILIPCLAANPRMSTVCHRGDATWTYLSWVQPAPLPARSTW